MNDMNHEDQYDTNNPGYFIAGLLFGSMLGGLIGAVIMLLLAPQSGERTRKQIRRKGTQVRKQAARAMDDGVKQVRSKANQVATGIQEQAEELQQRGQDAVDQQKERWMPVVEVGKAAVNGS